jgi:hypothetical protein
MSFIDKFVQGEIDFGTEEKREVMNKTVSVSTDPTEEKIKVDHLDSDNSMEKDILKQRKAERDVTGTVALPLFRFEEKQKKEIIEKIKDNVRSTTYYESAPSYDLYYTRTALKDASKREIGEKSIEKLFKKRGFQVFSPETLPLEEQISLLIKCNRFAATEGSCSHASVFCNSSAEVIILRKVNNVNWYSPMISDFVGNRTVFVDANHSVMANKKAPVVGPFYLYVTKELSRFWGQKSFVVPLFFRPSYWNYRCFFPIRREYYRLRAGIGLRRKLRTFISPVFDHLHD